MPREDARPRRSLPRIRPSHRRRGINTGVPSRKERARLNTSEHTARLAGRAAQHTPRSGRGSRDLIYGTVHPRVLFITCAGPRLVSLPSAPASALLGCCCSRVRSFAPSPSPFPFPARSLGRSLDALWSLVQGTVSQRCPYLTARGLIAAGSLRRPLLMGLLAFHSVIRHGVVRHSACMQ